MSPSVVTLTIEDNDNATSSNPIDNPGFYVRQHYLDFLNREPDASGLSFWTNQITSCGSDAGCIELKRINVSAAFFLSIEFQETGYLVYRMYKAAYANTANTLLPVKFNEFLRDTQLVGQGVQVGALDWQTKLETNKQAFAKAFVQRPEFLQAFPESLSGLGLVSKMELNTHITLSDVERSGLVSMIGMTPADPEKRATALRMVADDDDFRRAEFNSAFVLMQYMGYLRRNPTDPPDNSFSGYLFWLGKLNSFNGNFVNADMVKAFIVSGEYRHRFGP
ncbi:MAG: hypothetical protein DMF69_08985 [Acidobacteria bacterium]|nr:MAG: hypothetical protein DMF69_08985 [Acidobacteriota bacterium]